MTIGIEAGASRIEYSTKRPALAATIHKPFRECPA